MRARHTAVAGLLLCLGSTTACGQLGDATDASTRRDGPAKVGFVVASTQLNVAQEMTEGFRRGVAQVAGVQQTVVGPEIVDGPREVQLFNQVATDHRDGISVFTLSPELFAEPLARAHRSGIPLIAVDNPPPTGSKVGLFIGNDNYVLGQLLADQAIAELPADATGTVVLGITVPGVPVLEQRAAGIRDRLNEKRPGLTVLGPFDTKREAAANHAAWQVLVAANPDALAFLGTGDADGWNLAAIRKQSGATWIAGAYDLDPRALQAVREGHLLLVSPEHYLKGALAGQLQATTAATRAPLPNGWIYTPGLAVTPRNIEEILDRQRTPEAKAAWFAPRIAEILTGSPANLRPLTDVR